MYKIVSLTKKLLASQFYAMSLYARQIAGTVVLLLIVRFLSVYDYGLFASYNNIVAFCLLFANPGLSEYILVSSQNKIKEVQLKIGIFIFYSILVLLLIYAGSNFTHLESRLIFVLVLIRAYLDSVQPSLMFPYFQTAKKFNLVSCINIFYSFMTILLAIICYFYKLSLIKFLCMGIVLGVINVIQYSFYARINYILVIKNFSRLVKKIDKKIFAYIGTSFVFYAYNKIPSLYVATFIEKEQAALFFSAFAISNIISILMAAQYQKMIPEMIKKSYQQIKQIIKMNMIFLMGLNIVLFVFFLFTGKYFLHILYSKEYYENAYPYLLLLSLGNIAISYASIYGAYLTSAGYQDIKLKTMFFASIITITILFITNKSGIYSAIVAYIISAIFMSFSYKLKGDKYLHIQKNKEEENFVKNI